MDENNTQSENVTWERNIYNTWKKRSKLEHKLIIVLIVVTLLLFGFLVFLIIKLAAAPKICTTPACISAASQIVSHIDPSVNPCEDFFQFACGNFIKNSHGDLKTSSIKQIEVQVERQLLELLTEPITKDENPWIRSQKNMFRACMNETAVEEESLAVFEKTLKELNGWPVVVGYQWNEGAFDWKYMIYKLREKGYPYSVLLDVEIAHDPKSITHNIVMVSPPYFRKIEDEHKWLYKAYMTDVAVIFGADRNRAVIAMEKVFDLHENLRKIYENVYLKVENKNKTVNHTAVLLEGRMTVQKYQELNGDIEWLDFINTMLYPVGKITSDDYAVFPKLQFTKAFFRLLYRTNKRVLANYIIWMVIEEIMPFMTKELKQRSAKAGTPQTHITRREFCKQKIGKSYYGSSGPLDIMYARKYLPVDQRKRVEEMFANVKLEFVLALQKVSWMDIESKRKALAKARDVVGIIGAPGDYFNDAVLKQLFGDNYTEVQNDSFFSMLLNQQKITKDMLILHMHDNNTELHTLYQFLTYVNAMHWTGKNGIIIPVGILQGVFYNVDRPMYLNYGAMGSIIGHELTHGFGERGSEYEQDGYVIKMWTNATKKAYKERTECIVKEAEEFIIEDSEFRINGTLTLEENLADYTGVKVSYAAYNKWIQQNGKEAQLPHISYTPNQLFWISAVSYECFKLNKNDEKNQDPFHAHNSFRATAPLRNNPHFAQDFNCPVGSKMNPPKKCQVF